MTCNMAYFNHERRPTASVLFSLLGIPPERMCTITTKVTFSISPDRDWDYITLKGVPADHKFDAKTRQKLAAKGIYWSFKRKQYHSKTRINPADVQTALKGHTFLPLKGTTGYVAPAPKGKTTAKVAPKSNASVDARLDRLETLIENLIAASKK